MRAYIYFNELPVKCEFNHNGNTCVKQSTRTAMLTEFKRWFYYGKRELCTVNQYCRLDKDYFNI